MWERRASVGAVFDSIFSFLRYFTYIRTINTLKETP